MDELPPNHEKYKDYSLVTFMREESKEMWRRQVVPERLDSGAAQPPMPRTGASGALEHWRRGLVGAFQSWAVGSLDYVIMLVMKIIDHFKIGKDIHELLKPWKQGVCSAALAAFARTAATARAAAD